jgi:AcrR family transcriptional regulator
MALSGNPSTLMARLGRRPGGHSARADIVAAAREAFIEEGYDRPSLRGIARRAAVDPALVHHYFNGKADLFTEALKFGRDPREIVLEMSEKGGTGEDLVRAFLQLWEGDPGDEGGVPPFTAIAQAVSSSPQAAAGLREYLQDRVWSVVAGKKPGEGQDVRMALIASLLVGLGWVRYLLRLEPVASASLEDLARWAGPALDQYLLGLEQPSGAPPGS